jgi:nucleoid DNA-binding protein
MAGKTTNSVPWKEVLKQVSADSGIPSKTVDEAASATAATVEKLIRETRPTKIGETTVIKTPFGAYKTTYLPERTFQNPKTGEKIQRPAFYGINVGVPTQFIDSANTGINLEKSKPAADKAGADKKKTA